MDLSEFRRLLSSDGQAVLAEAITLRPAEATFLECHSRLRNRFPDDLVRTALATAMLRRKAVGKFSRADQMYFTREGLEQASGESISTYRARRFAQFERVGDWCCGIGGDSIGLARVAKVVAVDVDPLRLAIAEENVRVYGSADSVTFIQGDVTTTSIEDLDAAFLDPDRRADGRRHLRLREYAPPLNSVRSRLARDFPLGVKVAPGVPWADLHELDAEAEFVSVDGELKECVLWFGPLRTVARRSTVLPNGATLTADEPAAAERAGPPLAFLYDPDPAIVRSGLVANLGQQLGARPIDPEIAYLTSDRYMPTPFARCYEVEETMPFHARQLGDRLRSMNIGPVTLTKRGSAVDVDELRRRWKLIGTEAKTVILTRVLGKPTAIIARIAG